MTAREWSRSSAEYGRQLLHYGREGATRASESYLQGQSLSSFFSHSARHAILPAAVGACVGFLSCRPLARRCRPARAAMFGLLGAVAGFSAALAWKTRPWATTAASGALKSMGRIRDQHWLQRHPIDYA